MRKCTKCLVPETVDTISFDEEGVCSVCRQLEFKADRINWDERWTQLQESTAEYHSWYTFEEMEEVDEKRFNRLMNQGITADDMYEFLQGRVARRDLWMFDYPKRKDLMRLRVRSICLGNYIPWDTKANVA